MDLLRAIEEGDIIQFVTKVDNSSQGQNIQHVTLKVTEVNGLYIRGVNALRTLNSDDGVVFRTYRIANIVRDTVWKMIA